MDSNVMRKTASCDGLHIGQNVSMSQSSLCQHLAAVYFVEKLMLPINFAARVQ